MGAPARAERASAPKAATPVKVAPSKSSASPSPALNSAPPAVTLGATLAPDEVDLSSGQLVVSNADQIKEGESVEVKTRLPGLAEGSIKVWKNKDVFNTRGGGTGILLVHPILAKLGAPTVLVLQVKANVVTGYVTLGAPGAGKGKDRSLFQAMSKGADALNWLGLSNIAMPNVTNDFTGGALALGAEGMHFKVGGFLDGTGAFAIAGKDLTLDGSAKIAIPHGTEGNLVIKRDPKGALSGSVSVAVKVGGISGNVTGELTDGFVRVMGTVGYSSDKLSGSATLIATDEVTAREITRKKPQGGQIPQLDAESAKTNKPGKRAFCGFGELNFQINDWLAGSAQVVINSQGQATIIGEIAPPKEFILFEQKDWKKRIFKIEAKGGYGIPVVGQVFVFASAELSAKASVGPGKLYNIKLAGVYSTDPGVTQEMTLEASLNISAFAGLVLRAEGGVGLTILGHDIKAGVGIDATAGVRGYVEATPKIGMKKAPGQKTQYFIEGHMEIAAQPFLGLGGDLFVSVETPWWSPLSDKRWTWPLFSLEYPLPGEFGIGADVSYVLGSKKWPEISFGDVDFDASKFTTDVMGDNAPKGGGGEKKKPGKWKEGAGGEAPGSKGSAGGGAGKTKGGVDGFSDPIGEKLAFSDGAENHSLWILEKGGDAVPMVASEPEPPEKMIAAREKDIPYADKADQDAARKAAKSASAEAKSLKTKTQKLAKLKAAAANAQAFYDKTDKSEAKKKGPKDDPKKLQAAVRASERTLAGHLGALRKLTNMVPFEPIEESAKMRGGTEPVLVDHAKGFGALTVAGRKKNTKLSEVLAKGVLAKALHQQGKVLFEQTGDKILAIGNEVETKPIHGKEVNKRVRPSLKAAAKKAAVLIGLVGRKMRIANLDRAREALPLTSVLTLVFEAHPTTPKGTSKQLYKNQFRKELVRQLKRQQDGLNLLSIDQWLHNLVLYSMTPEIFVGIDRAGRQELLAELEERAANALQDARDNFDKKVKRLEDTKKSHKFWTGQLERAELRIQQLEASEAEIERARAQLEASTTEKELANKSAVPDRNILDPVRPAFQQTKYKSGKTSQKRYGNKVTGRMGGEKRAREKVIQQLEELDYSLAEFVADNADWSLIVKGASELHILHNPDQVAGGFDFDKHALPEKPKSTNRNTKEWQKYINDLRGWFGAKVVNSALGPLWSEKIPGARKKIMAPVNPAETYAINLLHFKLVPKVP